MTGLWIMSDLHMEILDARGDAQPRFVRPVDADVLLFAGDLHHADQTIPTARAMFGNDIPIILVAGNHEHYRGKQTVGTNLDLMRHHAARDCACGRITQVLENETAEMTIRGERIRFIGATLWTDFALFHDSRQGQTDAHRSMNDFREIRGNDPTCYNVRPSEMMAWHNESRRFLDRELRKPFDGSTVVVTHHAPSLRSVAERFRFDPATVAFASRCDDLLALGADLWVHGHTHDSFDYRAGTTRVICNPRGYQTRARDGYRTRFRHGGEIENQVFDPALVISIGADWDADEDQV